MNIDQDISAQKRHRVRRNVECLNEERSIFKQITLDIVFSIIKTSIEELEDVINPEYSVDER